MKQFNIMECYAGSLAYGTNLPTSDVDTRGIFCAEPKAIRTPFFKTKEQTIANAEDGKLYELTNFFKLFSEMNPNIIELMFVDQGDIIQTSPVYDYLRSEAEGLLSKKVAFSFSGYAISQLKRIKGHDKWINNPQPEKQPGQFEYLRLIHSYMESAPVLKHEEFMSKLLRMNDFCSLLPFGNNTYAVIEDFNSPGIFNADQSLRKLDYECISDAQKMRKPIFIVKYMAEDHKQAKEKHANYWRWKENRNETRHQLEVDFGYDTKHAMHLVRLLRMGEEILTTGKVHVKRPDAQELLSIRAGAWGLDELIDYAEKKDNLIRGEFYKNSHLPHRVDLDKISRVLMTAQDMCWEQIR